MPESMCVVCHGPVPRNRWGRTAATCNANCHRYSHRLRSGAALSVKYQIIRAQHEYRRGLEAVLYAIEQRITIRRHA